MWESVEAYFVKPNKSPNKFGVIVCSNKTESSVDPNMDDMPSNYNV